ncbi:DNA/RNA-binding protein Alba (modular protein) [Nitrosotalea sinensis]|jgi:DNA-binding protein|uniref:DNA/RNA-binding protein Alba n=2 Tax=Nitrosotalea sinensis TaxID=1499975 RepID=A0A2H1EIT5_9ARCH|nr:DNA/RNA-binding protein Alba (modular protein) [Candidatus Nitrosotalea sinensis]
MVFFVYVKGMITEETFMKRSFPHISMSTDAQNEAKDTVFIGKKPIMAYVTSALIQLANNPQVVIKARGLSIGRAVDVAQIIARRTDNTGYSIGQVKIGSEQLQSLDGRSRNVSTIEIEVKKNA